MSNLSHKLFTLSPYTFSITTTPSRSPLDPYTLALALALYPLFYILWHEKHLTRSPTFKPCPK